MSFGHYLRGHCAECRYAEGHYAGCRYAVCHYGECWCAYEKLMLKI
jgi:hypothetical protein